MSSGKKVLIPTLRFPPAGGVGLRRIIKLSKYLSRQGMEVHFITTINRMQTNNYLADVEQEKVIIRRIPSLSLNNYLNRYRSNMISKILARAIYMFTRPLFFVDYAFLWGLIMIPYLMFYIKKNHIKNIYCSAPPFSTLWHSALVKKILGKQVNLVCEWRDLWINDYERQFLPPKKITKNIERLMENFVIKVCDSGVVVTSWLMNSIKPEYRHKFYVFENGYDPASFTQNVSTINRLGIASIVYTGNIVDTRAEGFFCFLRAFRMLSKNCSMLKFELCGELSYSVKKILLDKYSDLLGNKSIVLHGVVSTNEAIEILNRAEYALVLVQRQHPEALTSKFFEYCAAEKKIIAIGPTGNLEQKNKENHVGCFVRLDDTAPEEKIMKFITMNKGNKEFDFGAIKANNDFSYIAERLSKLFI